MKVLDLYSGSGGWTQAFRQRGHETLSIDNDPDSYHDIQEDILELQLWDLPEDFREPDVILASPPCKVFSMGGAGSDPNTEGSGSDLWEYRDSDVHHPYFGPRVPKNEKAKKGCKMVTRSLEIIRELQPTYWWLENPRGGLKTMKFMEDIEHRTEITYCRYGEDRMKATSLWGLWPTEFAPRPKCKAGGYGTVEFDGMEWRTDPDGYPCHHSAPRGSDTGTQGLSKESYRYRIPFGLSWDVCYSAERALNDIPKDRQVDMNRSKGSVASTTSIPKSDVLELANEYPEKTVDELKEIAEKEL